MATPLSDETKAIIETLKNEGDLVRNRGKNSIREVNIKLDKFMPVFQNIKNEMMMQTDILRKQAKMAKDDAELRRRRADYDELNPPASVVEPSLQSPPSTADDDSNADKKLGVVAALMEGGIMGNLKDLFLLSAGGFGMYNLAKGFIDEKYDGAFSNMESNIGELATQIGSMSAEGISTGFESFKTGMTDLNTNLANMNANMTSINELIENMKSPVEWALDHWKEITIALAVGGWSVRRILNKVFPTRVEKMLKDLEVKNNQILKELDNAAQRAGKIATPSGMEAPKVDNGTKLPTGGYDEVPNTRPIPKLNTPGGPGTVPTVEGPGGSPRVTLPQGTSTGRVLGEVAQDAANMLPDQFKIITDVNGNQSLRTNRGQFGSVDAALKELEKTLNPKYSKVFKYLVRGFIVLGAVFTIADIVKLYMIFNTPESEMNHEQKLQAAAPIFGPLVTSTIAGGIGAAIGLTVGGPWGALILGGGSAIAAGMLTPYEFSLWLLKAVLGEPDTEAKAQMFQQITSVPITVKGTQYNSLADYLGSGGKLSRGQQRSLSRTGKAQFGGVRFSRRQIDMAKDLAAGMSPGDLGIEGFYTGSGGFRDFGTGTLAMLHGTEAVVPRNSTAGQLLAMIYDQGQAMSKSVNGTQGILNKVAMGSGSAPITIVNSPTVAPNVNNVIQGGSVMNQTTLLNNSSGGNGNYPFSMLPGGVN